MYCAVNVAKPADGKIADFTAWMQEWMGVMTEHDVTHSIKVASVGEPEPHVYAITMAKDAQEFGEQMDAVRGSSSFKAWYGKAASNRISHGVDSFMMDLQEGYDSTPTISEGVIVSTIWAVDNLLEFYTNVATARDIHEKNGAIVRAWSIYGGRYAGAMAYNMSFASMAAYGKAFEGARAEMQALNREVVAKGTVSARVLAGTVLENPIIVA
tara:strand:+ start:54 stop:689 length:636 start_codon:yes stop_codon:yes gene_type:complete